MTPTVHAFYFNTVARNIRDATPARRLLPSGALNGFLGGVLFGMVIALMVMK